MKRDGGMEVEGRNGEEGLRQEVGMGKNEERERKGRRE